jgi:hypothetical protein
MLDADYMRAVLDLGVTLMLEGIAVAVLVVYLRRRAS